MTLVDTVQLQETGSSLIELFEITLPAPISTTVYLTNGLDDGSENIYFGSSPTAADPSGGATLNEYIAVPIQLKGIEFNAGGAAPRPTLSVANLVVLARSFANNSDGTNDETTLDSILQSAEILSNDGLLGSKVVFRTTLESKIFKVGDVSGYSAEVPQEFPSQTFIVDRIVSESALIVEFELTSPFDLERVQVPGRIIVAQYCPWRYQGILEGKPGGCSYALNSNGRFFDKNDNLITRNTNSAGVPQDSSIAVHSNSTNYSTGDLAHTVHTTNISNDTVQIWRATRAHSNKPPLNSDNVPINSLYWVRHDVCGKTLNSCKIRYQGNNTDDTLNEEVALAFGAFPGVTKFR